MIRGLRSDLPASGIARDFVSPAGVRSFPNTLSTGLALRLGHARPAPIHPGLVSLPGSQSILLRFTNRLQPASDPVREGAQSDPGVGLFHPSRMETTHGKVREAFNAKLSGA